MVLYPSFLEDDDELDRETPEGLLYRGQPYRHRLRRTPGTDDQEALEGAFAGDPVAPPEIDDLSDPYGGSSVPGVAPQPSVSPAAPAGAAMRFFQGEQGRPDPMRQAAQYARDQQIHGAIGGLADAFLTGGANTEMLRRGSQDRVNLAFLRAGQVAAQQRQADTDVKAQQKEEAALAKREADMEKARARLDPTSPENIELQRFYVSAGAPADMVQGLTVGNHGLRKKSLDQYLTEDAKLQAHGKKADIDEMVDVKYAEQRRRRKAKDAYAVAKSTEGIKKGIAAAGAARMESREERAAREWDRRESVKQGVAEKKDLRTRKQKYGEAIQKQGLVGARTALKELKGNIADLKRKGRWGDKMFTGKTPIDSAGNWIAAKAGAIGAADEDLQPFLESYQRIINQVLKERSGAAVTQQEYERLMKEFGASATQGPTAIARAVKKIERALQRDEDAVKRTYGMDAVQAYEGESPSSRAAREGRAAVPGKVRVRLASGRTGSLPAGQVDEFLRRNPGAEVLGG